jgi:hypothetical protein
VVASVALVDFSAQSGNARSLHFARSSTFADDLASVEMTELVCGWVSGANRNPRRLKPVYVSSYCRPEGAALPKSEVVSRHGRDGKVRCAALFNPGYCAGRVSAGAPHGVSLSGGTGLQPVAPSHDFEFGPHRIFDGDYRTRLHGKGGQHRAKLVDCQRVVAVHQ